MLTLGMLASIAASQNVDNPYDQLRRAMKSSEETNIFLAQAKIEDGVVSDYTGPIIDFGGAIDSGIELGLPGSSTSGFEIPGAMVDFLPKKEEISTGWIKKMVRIDENTYPYLLTPAFPSDEEVMMGWMKKQAPKPTKPGG